MILKFNFQEKKLKFQQKIPVRYFIGKSWLNNKRDGQLKATKLNYAQSRSKMFKIKCKSAIECKNVQLK